MPKVSIAMPAYNCEKYIARSLESLLGQTYGDFELIISDNASTDGTEAVCRRFAAQDKRVRYVRRIDNIGGPGNFRHVFALSSGTYHKWSTADDYWHPAFLQEAVDILDRQADVVLCYPKTRKIDLSGATISDYEDTLHLVDSSPRTRFRQLYERIGLCNAHLGLIRRETMLTTRLIAGHRASDIDFLGEMVLRGKFWLIPEVRFFRRFHPESSSWARADSEHQRKYYAPLSDADPGMHAWRRILFEFGAVWRSPIGLVDKLALTTDVGRWTRYARHGLSEEVLGRIRRRSRDA